MQATPSLSSIHAQLDESTINITSSSLRTALVLSAADRRWIDFLSATVHDTWDENNPSRPKTMGYMGSEEFIRLQFEEYILALLSSVKYHLYLSHSPPLPTVEGDPTSDYNPDFIHNWRQTSNFALFDSHTDSHLFDIVEPRHPTAGNLSFEDIQRRLALQIQTLHLDDRLATSKEALNKHLATGHKKVSTAFSNLWADIEAMREAQRKRAETAHLGAGSDTSGEPPLSSENTPPAQRFAARAPDLTAAQASVQAAGQKAGAYISSWGAWASERRKGWVKGTPTASGESVVVAAGGGGGGGGGLSPTKVGKWNSGIGGGKRVREEKGGDGIGRLDA